MHELSFRWSRQDSSISWMLHAYIIKCIWKTMHTFQRFEIFFKKSKHLPPFLALVQFSCFCSLFFWNRNSLLNCNFFFFFPLKLWAVSCHWPNSRSSVMGSMFPCETEPSPALPGLKQKAAFPWASKWESSQSVMKFSFRVIQITTSVFSCDGDRCMSSLILCTHQLSVWTDWECYDSVHVCRQVAWWTNVCPKLLVIQLLFWTWCF